MDLQIATKEVAAQTVTSVRRRLEIADLSPYVTQSIAKMRQVLRGAGIPEAGVPFSIFHERVGEERAGEVEVCVPCAADALDEDVVERRDLPATAVAYVTLANEQARYPEILDVYEAIAASMLRDGHLLGEGPREIYHDTQTEIAWPIGRPASTEHVRPPASANDDVG